MYECYLLGYWCRTLNKLKISGLKSTEVKSHKRYIDGKCDYWRKQGVRTASVSLWTRLTKQWFDWERDLYVRNGFGVYELGKPVLYLSDPELIREVLVKDFHIFTNRRKFITDDPMINKMVFSARDSEWKRLRTVMSPTFTTGKLKRMTPLILECVDTMNDNIDKIIAKNDGQLSAPVDMKRITGAYGMEVVIQVAFGRKVSALVDPNNPIIENALTQFFHKFTLNLIDERKRGLETESSVKRVDFLQLMLDSMRDNNDEAIDGSDEYTDSLTNDELIAQCVLFLVAGYETSATTLSMCLYTIAKHPEVQQKLYEEINKFHEHQKSNADPYEAFHALKYMDAVIDETLRLFPAAIFIERVPTEDYELTGTGITIKKDHVVHIPAYAIHRDPEYFADPEVFRPERFLPENIAHNPYTYLPFGAGPRNCLGMRLAQLEIKLALVNLVQRYKPLELGVAGGLIIPKSVDLRISGR
ncbi:unnamed protein product [Oppiella nova]|uniref:Cytochrome P450 n=1 Tax=Oppiella nova TaxID=334625 RepID=A0A7R9LSN7_9ACAR|nr:unnamed protein product [Oppiella nova]CAG2166571.1 unnamed protein product [Oppiella nova]